MVLRPSRTTDRLQAAMSLSVLRFAGLAALVSLTLAGCSTERPAAVRSDIYQSQSKPGASLDKATAASMVSELRRGRGLGPVTLDPALNRMAEEQALAMSRAGRISHDSLAGPLKARIARSYPQNGGVWENVGAGHDTLADAFTGWKSSPPHLRNMTQPKASRMGIAAVHAPGSRYEVFWAMVLADPVDPRVAAYAPAAAAPAAGATQADPPSGAQIAAQIPTFRPGAPGQIYLGR